MATISYDQNWTIGLNLLQSSCSGFGPINDCYAPSTSNYQQLYGVGLINNVYASPTRTPKHQLYSFAKAQPAVPGHGSHLLLKGADPTLSVSGMYGAGSTQPVVGTVGHLGTGCNGLVSTPGISNHGDYVVNPHEIITSQKAVYEVVGLLGECLWSRVCKDGEREAKG